MLDQARLLHPEDGLRRPQPDPGPAARSWTASTRPSATCTHRASSRPLSMQFFGTDYASAAATFDLARSVRRSRRHAPDAGPPMIGRLLRPWRRSLRARLVGYFLLLSTVTVLIVGAVVYVRATADLTNGIYDRLDAVAAIKADALDRWIDEQTRNVVYVGSIPGFGDDARAFLDPATTPDVRAAAQGRLRDDLGDRGLQDGRCRGDLHPRPRWHDPALDPGRATRAPHRQASHSSRMAPPTRRSRTCTRRPSPTCRP